MPYSISDYINIISQNNPRCSYIFTKGKDKDSVCGKLLNNESNLAVKYWRCNKCSQKVNSITSHFDNIIAIRNQNVMVRNEGLFLLSASDLRELFQLQGSNLLNKDNSSISAPKIYEENEPCDRPCIICLNKAPRIAIIPCGHLILCQDCSNSQNIKKLEDKCPLCKNKIDSLLRIYN